MKRFIIIFIVLILIWLARFIWVCFKCGFRACGNDVHGECDKDDLDRMIFRAMQSFAAYYNGPDNRFIKVIYWFVFYEKFIDEQYRD